MSAITSHSVLGYENYVDHPSANLVGLPSVVNVGAIADPLLGTVSTQSDTTLSWGVTGETSASAPFNAVYVRFRDGWSNAVSLQFSLYSDAGRADLVYVNTVTISWPSAWPLKYPRRPIARMFFETVYGRYWKASVVRSTATPLQVARLYVGPVAQFGGTDTGSERSSSRMTVVKASEEVVGDLGTNFRFNRPQRRSVAAEISGVPVDRAREVVSPQIMFASATEDVLYCMVPSRPQTDALMIQHETIWGALTSDGGLTFSTPGFWDFGFTVMERI